MRVSKCSSVFFRHPPLPHLREVDFPPPRFLPSIRLLPLIVVIRLMPGLLIRYGSRHGEHGNVVNLVICWLIAARVFLGLQRDDLSYT